MADLQFQISAKSESATRTVVEARNFKLIIDEPESLGGTDAGPNPVEYELAALSGCLNVMGHLVAREMGFELRGVSMELEGNLNPGRFSGASMKERAGYKNIRVKIQPDSDADQETLKEWLKTIENRCPVSDNLSHSTPVELVIASD
ncbi:MAG: osmotically inducible protein C [Leptospiraceae bacterium]|nr:osmotically inducible protein C [Leptospiraceae bacterium]